MPAAPPMSSQCRPRMITAEKGELAKPPVKAMLIIAATVEQEQLAAADRVAVDMALHAPPLMAVQPVDIDLAVAVADIEDDGAVAALHEFRRAENAVAAGRRHDDIGLGKRRTKRQAPAAEMHRLQLADRVALGHGDDRPEVPRPLGDAAADRPEADDEDPPAEQRQPGDAPKSGPSRFADMEAVVERILQHDAVPVEDRER